MRFQLGTWGVVKDTYVLKSCPIGYELTASIGLDECVPCPADFFKLEVGLGKCTGCPAGTTCSGGGQIFPRSGFWVDPDVASGKAAEFAPADLVEAHFYVEEGNRRSLVLSGEIKAGRVQDVKVLSEPVPLNLPELPFELGLKLAVNRIRGNFFEQVAQRCGNWSRAWPSQGLLKY